MEHLGGNGADEAKKASISRSVQMAGAILVLSGACAAMNHLPSGEMPLPGAIEVGGQPLPPQNLLQCPAATDAARQQVEQALAKPQDYQVESAITQTGPYKQRRKTLIISNHKYDRQEGERDDAKMNNDVFNAESALALSYGLQLHNPRPYLQQLPSAVASSTERMAIPFNTYYKTANAYLGTFGINLSLGSPSDGSAGISIKPPTAKELDTLQARDSMLDLIETYSSKPTDLVALSNVKNIILTDDITDKHKQKMHTKPTSVTVAYETNRANRNDIVFNMKFEFTDHVLDHEEEHAIDEQTCGGSRAAANDPAYAAANPADYYSSSKLHPKGTRHTVASSEGTLDNYSERVNNAADAHDTATACKLQDTGNKVLDELAKTTYFTSDYATTNVVEDKAELQLELDYPPLAGENFSPRFPALRRKAIELTARLMQYAPGVAKYMLATDRRLSNSLDTIDSCTLPRSSQG